MLEDVPTIPPTTTTTITEPRTRSPPTPHPAAIVFRQRDIRRTRSLMASTAPGPNEVMKGLFIGDLECARDAQDLKRRNISGVLNASVRITDAYFPDEFEYLILEMPDSSTTNLLEYLPRCFAFIDSAVDNGKSVLVHCIRGVSRSAAIVLAYMMYKEHRSLDDALDHLSRIRPTVLPNPGFLRQLHKFEQQQVKLT